MGDTLRREELLLYHFLSHSFVLVQEFLHTFIHMYVYINLNYSYIIYIYLNMNHRVLCSARTRAVKYVDLVYSFLSKSQQFTIRCLSIWLWFYNFKYVLKYQVHWDNASA